MRAIAVTSVLFMVVSCVPPRRAGVGVECEINSECDTPLVCRLGHCRNECATSADCAAGLSCVLDSQGLGACQRPAETSCTAPSECPAGLVCRFMQCTNACETDRDCPGGARCEVDGDGLACIDRSGTPCTFDEECDPIATGERCLSGRCRRECFSDRDCGNDFWCDLGRCTPPPRVMRDGGTVDAGDVDGGGPESDSGMPSTRCDGVQLGDVEDLDAFGTVTCAATSGVMRDVVCWGATTPLSSGALYGGATDVACARSVGGLAGLVIDGVAVADSSVCVLRAGEVSCLGWDQYGQLGNGVGLVDTSVPGIVAGVSGITTISGGGLGTYIAWNAGGGWGWGRTDNGSIGDGSTDAPGQREIPASLTAFMGTPIRALETAVGNTCAIVEVAAVPTMRCVGRGFTFGDGGGPTISDANDVAVGEQFGCAIDDVSVSCWGTNSWGEVGDGTTLARIAPVPVMLPRAAVEIDASQFHACARLDDGSVYCWGRSAGFDPSHFPAVALPDPQLVFEDAGAVRCGAEHTCIITNAGGVQCIGLDALAVGNGSMFPPLVPVDVYRE